MSNTNNQNSCLQKPCHGGKFDPFPNSGTDDNNQDLLGRPVLYTGVLWIGILRKFLIPRPQTDCRPCCPRKVGERPEAKEVALVSSSTIPGNYIKPSAHAHHKPHELRDEEGELLRSRGKQGSKHSPLAILAYQIKEASATLKEEARQFSDDLSEIVQDSKATTSETLHTLRENEGVAGRFSAITITSLLGYMAGVRRNVAVKLVYATTGAVAMATLCYPEEARHYNDLALSLIQEGVLLSVQLLGFGFHNAPVVKDSVEEEKSTARNNEKNTPESYSMPIHKTETQYKTNNNNAAFQQKSIAGNYEKFTQELYSKPSEVRKTKSKTNNNASFQEKLLAGNYEQFTQEPHCKPSEKTDTKSKTNNNNAAPQEKCFSRFELEEKPNHLSETTDRSSLQENWSLQEQQERPPRGSHSQFAVRRGNLSQQCQQDETVVVPYSPALPPLPETEPENFQNPNTHSAYHEEPNTTPIDGLETDLKEKTDVCPGSLDDSHISLETSLSENYVTEPKNEHITKIIPTNEPIKETETQDTLKIENNHNSQHFPLNKKLSRYYKQRKSDQFTSPEAENGELHKDNKQKGDILN